MQYLHDCKRCTPLKTFEGFDLYVCEDVKHGCHSIIARYGNEPEQYESSSCFRDRNWLSPQLRQALRAAEGIGLKFKY